MSPADHGRARHCPSAFLQEHTLDRWAEAIASVLRALLAAQWITPGRLMLVGQSEGGVVAARLSALLPEVSHVALLGASGLGEARELALAARHAARGGMARAQATEQVDRLWAEIRVDPDSTTRFAWGHPFRRWPGFFGASTLDELLRGRAAVHIMHGAVDHVVPVAVARRLKSDLARHGRQAMLRVLPGAGHGLARRGQPVAKALDDAYRELAEWFFQGAQDG